MIAFRKPGVITIKFLFETVILHKKLKNTIKDDNLL